MVELERLLLPSPTSGDEQRPLDPECPAAEGADEALAELDRLIESLLPDSTRVAGAEDRRVASAYLIVSSKGALVERYGRPSFNQLDNDLRALKQAIETHTGLEASIIYVDDVGSLDPYGLQPVNPANPWQVKKLIDELDARLGDRGRAIRYLLIVGGDSVVPFHRLPNPADDQDLDVPSDNPYASRDANYLIPERAVGRIPDGEGEGSLFLRSLIQAAVAGHQRLATGKGLLDVIAGMFALGNRVQRNGHSLGYSASIWRKVSRAVFRVIGDDRRLRTSPPAVYQQLEFPERLHFSYFNLHGIEDGANWYGQRDPLFPADYPLFPVALSPEDLDATDHAGSVVFTEACYGANILQKDTHDSIALRLLALQVLAVVGSTKIAYGSITPPLLGADLLGKYFWEGLQARLTLGEALQYAKVNLARDMQERQGYLDGEDQKTLISFVLYGDPSLPVAALQDRLATGSLSKGFCPAIVCQKKAQLQKSRVSDELIAAVKERVEACLPHMAQAEMRVTTLGFCNGNCGQRCALAQGVVKVGKGQAQNLALTLEKSISVTGDSAHRQVVRVTVDETGHILKMAMSR